MQDVTGTVEWTYDALDRMTLEAGGYFDNHDGEVVYWIFGAASAERNASLPGRAGRAGDALLPAHPRAQRGRDGMEPWHEDGKFWQMNAPPMGEGFAEVKVFGDLDAAPYDQNCQRLVVLAGR